MVIGSFYQVFFGQFLFIRLDISAECLKSLHEVSDYSLDAVDEKDRMRNFTTIFMKHIHECMGERFDNVYLKAQQCRKPYTTSFLIGFRIGKNWSNPITVGPLATDPTAKVFRELWKGKTQLRRFADTRICECMVWADKSSSAVPYSILQFIVVNHFNFPLECISWRSVFPDDFLSSRDVNSKITSAFASLSAILRSAKSLPLMITNIQAVSSYMRDTEPCASDVVCSSTWGAIENDHRLPIQRNIPPYLSYVDGLFLLHYC
ncbi:hypothetical protein DICVIV_06193 [Dictyocaulus viviparus]|uniref:Nucleolar protein 6 n=1 Tax=Dictyocaulus viviparus TaxID=29172 RepID=A0A0D8XZH5_DICVI|nr:hypothetical protein DICVIV_06193 [Dictyocaulus viviparus]